jgi:hypothetical protein
MKKIILFLIVLSAWDHSAAQMIQPNTLAVGGSYFSTANFSVSYTVGEMTAVETFFSPQLIVTQGFQQPDETFTGMAEVSGEQLDAIVFPNPVSESRIFLSFQAHLPFVAAVNIHDISGRRVYSKEWSGESGYYEEEIYLSGLQNGMYFLIAEFRFNDGTYYPYNTKINFIK